MFAWVGGGFRTTRPHVRVQSAFRQVSNVFVRVAGAWRPAWSYRWNAGGWGGCSASCGGGTQSRVVRCVRNDGVEMSDAFCSQAGSKPSTSQSCNTQACYTYSWNWGNWGGCSAYCGYGTRSRSVWCQRSDGSTMSDSYCSGKGGKPAVSESCYAGACVTYKWATESWNACPASCGAGRQNRTVYCKGSDGGRYGDGMCSGTKPATSQSCSSCSGCPNQVMDGTAYVNNKVLQCNAMAQDGNTNWSPALVWTHFSNHGLTAPTHFVQYGRAEGVCPFAGATCCRAKGYIYYVGM